MTKYDIRVNANGFIPRSGLWREENDPLAGEYAKEIANAKVSDDCIFCPEMIDAQADILRLTSSSSEIAARPPYGHFAGYFVDEHRMTVPDKHVEAMWDLDKYDLRRLVGYTAAMNAIAEKNGQHVLSYTRSPNSLAKSIRHLHSHTFRLAEKRVTEFNYLVNTDGGGVFRLRGENAPIETATMEQFFGGLAVANTDTSELIVDDQFTISQVTNPWTHFDGHAVAGHEVITMVDEERSFAELPPRSLANYFNYLRERNEAIVLDEATNTFTQDIHIGGRAHLLTLSYNPVAEVTMNPNDGQEVVIANLTDEQIALINEKQMQRRKQRV